MNELRGDAGDDRFHAGRGPNRMTGGAGNDFFFLDVARTSGKFSDAQALKITDFTPIVNGSGSFLRPEKGFNDCAFAIASVVGDNVDVRLAISSKLDEPAQHRALAEAGRLVVFEISSLEYLTAGLEREGEFSFWECERSARGTCVLRGQLGHRSQGHRCEQADLSVARLGASHREFSAAHPNDMVRRCPVFPLCRSPP